MKVETVYTDAHGNMTIMLLETPDCWEVYYRAPMYAYEFAFGITHEYKLSVDEMMELAHANADEHRRLFFEEG